MPKKAIVNIAVEGDLDEVVLRSLLASVGVAVDNVYGKRGKNFLKENIRRYNQAAQYGDWVVLVDLNSDAECPPPFISSWLTTRNPNLQLRIAVRAIESWLLADRKEIAHFLRIPVQKVPVQPENEGNPKQTLINIARISKNKNLREDIIPLPKSTASQGPGYTSRLIEFTMNYWEPGRAAHCAPSLQRSINSLSRWKRGEY
jgi:hypothetical protein